MSLRLKSLVLCYVLLVTNACFSAPPYEVLKSCVERKALNASVSMQAMDAGYYSKKAIENCEMQYNLTYNNNSIGAMDCNDIQYIFINKNRFPLNAAVNLSANPDVEPGMLYPDSSRWFYIGYENIDYLCINGPLSESGAGAAVGQYYIVENVFGEIPIVYYYFLDKNIVSLVGPQQ